MTDFCKNLMTDAQNGVDLIKFEIKILLEKGQQLFASPTSGFRE